MKVIFLDIDGVLNTLDTFVRKKHLHGNVEIDEDRVLRLKQIIDETDAKIVLSSSWRVYYDDNLIPHGKGILLNNVLKQYELFIYDKTPNKVGIREKEIQSYLDSHDIEKFIILDDEISDLESFKDRGLIQVHCNFQDFDPSRNGLLDKHVEMAINQLNYKVYQKR